MSESSEQILLVQWAKRQRKTCPEIRWLHHIPNGGGRTKRDGANLKLEGVEKGIPDLFLPVARHEKHGLYIEMKSVTGKIRAEQKEFGIFAIKQDYAYRVCRSFEEGKKVLKKYLGI